MQLTRIAVVEAIRNTLATIRQWEESNAPTVNWRNQQTQEMSEAVETAIDDLCDLCGAASVSDDAKEVVMQIDVVRTEFVAWAEAVSISPESVHPSGTPELRTAIRLLGEACNQSQTRRLPENIRDLMEAGAGDEQICKIYGFLNDDGSVNMSKLAEEKRIPGTHFNADTWVAPWLKRRQLEINDRWSQRSSVMHTRVGAPLPKPRPVAPESIDDLLAQNVHPEQIALMKGITVEAVEEHAARQGVPIAGRTTPDPSRAELNKRELDKRRSESLANSHPEIDNMEERIAACWLDDMKPKEIAESLQTRYPDLSWQKVAALVREFAKDDPTMAATT